VIRTGIYVAWVVIGLVWVVGALSGKETTRRQKASGGILHVVLTGLAFYLLFGHAFIRVMDVRMYPESLMLDGIGFVSSIAGIAFAIGARVLLGTNWSAMVTQKENHELVRRGPYAIVRHPIYSGALLGMLGTAIVFGQLRGFLAVGIAFIAWWMKSRVEERFMVDLFGDQYRRYQAEVRALIPGLL
jgi:protein-S-isoprenylcysteine O-methyltransferase Ste14